jgi:hypothetical protein
MNIRREARGSWRKSVDCMRYKHFSEGLCNIRHALSPTFVLSPMTEHHDVLTRNIAPIAQCSQMTEVGNALLRVAADHWTIGVYCTNERMNRESAKLHWRGQMQMVLYKGLDLHIVDVLA